MPRHHTPTLIASRLLSHTLAYSRQAPLAYVQHDRRSRSERNCVTNNQWRGCFLITR